MPIFMDAPDEGRPVSVKLTADVRPYFEAVRAAAGGYIAGPGTPWQPLLGERILSRAEIEQFGRIAERDETRYFGDGHEHGGAPDA